MKKGRLKINLGLTLSKANTFKKNSELKNSKLYIQIYIFTLYRELFGSYLATRFFIACARAISVCEIIVLTNEFFREQLCKFVKRTAAGCFYRIGLKTGNGNGDVLMPR